MLKYSPRYIKYSGCTGTKKDSCTECSRMPYLVITNHAQTFQNNRDIGISSNLCRIYICLAYWFSDCDSSENDTIYGQFNI